MWARSPSGLSAPVTVARGGRWTINTLLAISEMYRCWITDMLPVRAKERGNHAKQFAPDVCFSFAETHALGMPCEPVTESV